MTTEDVCRFQKWTSPKPSWPDDGNRQGWVTCDPSRHARPGCHRSPPVRCPPTMVDAAAERRSAGDWHGACAAADVEIRLNPELAPDLLRWHIPRCGHGAGPLAEGLLIPLADYADASRSGIAVTLVAATPQVALAAGQRIVLTVVEGVVRQGPTSIDPAVRAVLDDVRGRSADRYCLRRNRDDTALGDSALRDSVFDSTARLSHGGDLADRRRGTDPRRGSAARWPGRRGRTSSWSSPTGSRLTACVTMVARRGTPAIHTGRTGGTSIYAPV